MKRKSQQGVALVITLILLSVITFMAVTFLVVSRKEAAQVGTLTQQNNAKFASEAGLEEAKAQIIAQMLATGNGLNFGLLVSTNFISGTNYNRNTTNIPPGASLTNVTYNFAAGDGTPQLEQMLANLMILPRPPVFIVTNKTFPNNLDFRYYLDLNRNGRYDTNGAVVEGSPGNPLIPITNIYTGDPEWVGILNHPDQPHSSSNFFIARYCFIALPIGNSLDINYIGNQAKRLTTPSAASADSYVRNEGVGSWEINLAAFLHALNTNWDNTGVSYGYNANLGEVSKGISFDDASAILQYRYGGNYNNLRTFSQAYGTAASALFGSDFIDGYSSGPLMTGLSLPTLTGNLDPDTNEVSKNPWSGDNNTNVFFTTQDLFNQVPFQGNNALLSFSNRLYAAGRNFNVGNAPYSQVNNSQTNSYNRYTFYRMLSQLSFGSAPESSLANNANIVSPIPNFTPSVPGYYPYTNRMNLNYCNVGGLTGTNFQAWTPLQFFTNCANRLLANAGYTNTVSNIPIYPTNYYTPALNRLLQLAANIYDATTNRFIFDPVNNTNFYYPSVFRPTFGVVGTTNIFINGYVEDTPGAATPAAYQNIPYSLPDNLAVGAPGQISLLGALAIPNNTNINIYGIPWIIGAKKGFPNFNEFSMASATQITRKMEVIYLSQTNVQYTVGVSNVFGIEAWNSYVSNYSRSASIVGVAGLGMSLIVTNAANNPGPQTLLVSNLTGGASMTFGKTTSFIVPAKAWAGFAHPTFPGDDPNSFKIPLLTNYVFLPDSVYHPDSLPHLSASTNFETSLAGTNLPHFILSYSNRVQYAMVDTATGRVLDYVSLGNMNFTRDLTAELPGTDNGGDGGVWLTNNQNGLAAGLQNQLLISEGSPVANFNSSDWIPDQLVPTSQSSATQAFAAFMGGRGGITNAMQAPYTPTRKVEVNYTWQANDPLVHYMLEDLTPQAPVQANIITNWISVPSLKIATNLVSSLGQVNKRYLPWNNQGNPLSVRADTQNASNLQVKDPGVVNSDAWQFPTGKFPNIGWLGRVHRGTPWQTVYMKSSAVTVSNWLNWTGDTNITSFGTNTTSQVYGTNMQNAVISLPTTDWTLFDLFTTSPNDNASRGQLSVNQTNMAAWAALLDGVIVVSNTPTGLTSVVIDPITNQNSSFLQIYNDINAQRAATSLNNVAINVFTNVGQILSVPSLSVNSPYINPANAATLNDEVYERIPQQIMSLLRLGSPRYVIFAYGQSLQPAPNSIVTSGSFFGLCTNYQITGEVATRTVLRIDNPPVPGRAQPAPTKAVVETFNVLPPE